MTRTKKYIYTVPIFTQKKKKNIVSTCTNKERKYHHKVRWIPVQYLVPQKCFLSLFFFFSFNFIRNSHFRFFNHNSNSLHEIIKNKISVILFRNKNHKLQYKQLWRKNNTNKLCSVHTTPHASHYVQRALPRVHNVL